MGIRFQRMCGRLFYIIKRGAYVRNFFSAQPEPPRIFFLATWLYFGPKSARKKTRLISYTLRWNYHNEPDPKFHILYFHIPNSNLWNTIYDWGTSSKNVKLLLNGQNQFIEEKFHHTDLYTDISFLRYRNHHLVQRCSRCTIVHHPEPWKHSNLPGIEWKQISLK